MEEDMKRRSVQNRDKVSDDRYGALADFAKKLQERNKGLISSIAVRNASLAGKSVDLTMVVDDLNNVVIDNQVADIKVAAAEMAYSAKIPIECETLLASSLWEGFRSMDTATLDFMRDSLFVYDNGFCTPIQDLLVTGKIRPSKESVNVYFVKSERSLKNAGQHVSRAVIDLYWAVVDAAHAAVMVAGLTPPSPKDLAETVKKELVQRNLVNKRCGEIVQRMYDAAKQIMHREVFEISGKEFDSYLADADFFMKEMDEFVKEHMK